MNVVYSEEPPLKKAIMVLKESKDLLARQVLMDVTVDQEEEVFVAKRYIVLRFNFLVLILT